MIMKYRPIFEEDNVLKIYHKEFLKIAEQLVSQTDKDCLEAIMNTNYLERNIFLTKILKVEWRYKEQYLDFSTWEGFGILWTWAIKQDWWLEWWKGYYANYLPLPAASIPQFIINPNEFANTLYTYLRYK